jgi:DNA-binding NarL/FixJ family response regulator
MSAVANEIRILAVDDHAGFREGLAVFLASQPDMNLVAQAASGSEAIQQFRAHQPDVTLMDLQMPGMSGLEAMRAIHAEFPNARMIILTTYPREVEDAIKMGARAFLLKAQLGRDLFRTIRDVQSENK